MPKLTKAIKLSMPQLAANSWYNGTPLLKNKSFGFKLIFIHNTHPQKIQLKLICA